MGLRVDRRVSRAIFAAVTLPSRQHNCPPYRDSDGDEADLVAGASVFVTEVDDYDFYRSMLYALGAKAVSNKRVAGVTTIVHGKARAPAQAREKYPSGRYIRADRILAQFRRRVPTFGAFVEALQAHGFTVRNPSDEGDPRFDHFELPLVDGSLHATLLHYLSTSPFIRGFAHKQHFPIDTRVPDFLEFPIPGTDVTWYSMWITEAWWRVSASRGEGDHPLEIKGPQLLAVAPALWTESAGLHFYEYPHSESIDGLFIQAGIGPDRRVNGSAISRVWT